MVETDIKFRKHRLLQKRIIRGFPSKNPRCGKRETERKDMYKVVHLRIVTKRSTHQELGPTFTLREPLENLRLTGRGKVSNKINQSLPLTNIHKNFREIQ